MKLRQRIAAFLQGLPGASRLYVSRKQAGVIVTPDTALTFSGWFAGVSYLARTLASLPWGVYQKTARGREPTPYGLVEWLLNNQPNPEMTAVAFKEAIVAHALNWGNGYAEIQTDAAGRPVGLWLLEPDRVSPGRDNGRLVYEYIAPDGTKRILEAWQVYHLHGLSFDGITGYSAVTLAARSLGLAIAQEKFGSAFFENGTVVGAIVEMPGTMNAQQLADSEDYFNGKHRGAENAFRMRVSPSGTKVHPLSMPMTDAQFIESRRLSVTDVARWLGLPPHKLADLERSTNNNIEHQAIEVVQDAIVPWCVRMEQEANVKLIGARNQGRVYTKLSVQALMRGDAKSRAEFYRTMTQIGAFTINKVLELEDENGIGPAGDVRLVQLNQTTLDYLIENPGAKTQENEPPKQEDEPSSDLVREARAQQALLH